MESKRVMLIFITRLKVFELGSSGVAEEANNGFPSTCSRRNVREEGEPAGTYQ